jgi:phycobilisome rod-core linker protein
MAIPILEYVPKSQNQRVEGFEVAGDEQPRIYTTDNLLSASDMDTLIRAAYRQILNEQQMTASSRQMALESQLRAGQITVRDFIRGLATSDVFRTRNYDTNNNYRLVQMCVQRILGREVYNDREKLAWSIVLAAKGLKAFIDALVDSGEYLNNFGDSVVPYQRRRILQQRATGELPFARMARYDAYYRNQLPKPYVTGRFAIASGMSAPRWAWQRQTPASVQTAWRAIVSTGGFLLSAGVLAIFLSFWGLIKL